MARNRRKPETPAAEIDWTRVRIAAAILAIANILMFIIEAWKVSADKAQVAALMHQIGAQPWPYPAYDPGYPFGIVNLPDGSVALYNTTPDYLPVYLAFMLLVICLLSGAGLIKRPGRLLGLWPVVAFTLIAFPSVAAHAMSVIQLPDLFEAAISPSARTLTNEAGTSIGLCQPAITVAEGSSSKGGALHDVYLGSSSTDSDYVTSFPEQETAAAFAALVATKAKQAGCGAAMQMVFKN
jgi:hypothetical protein